MLRSLVVANSANYIAEKWHVTLLIFAMLVIGALINIFSWPLIPWIEMHTGVLIFFCL